MKLTMGVPWRGLYILVMALSHSEGQMCKDWTVMIPEGDPACLPCNKSLRDPGISNWFIRNESTQHLQDEDRLYVDDQGNLYLAYVKPGDSGLYDCAETKEDAFASGTSVSLGVSNISGVTERKPSLLLKSPHVRSTPYPEQLFCVLAGRPVPNISWYLEDNNLSSGVHTDGMKSTLNISRVISPGESIFTCKGVNGHGEAEAVIVFNTCSLDTKALLIGSLAGPALVFLIVAILTGRCCYDWCRLSRKRKEMLRKEEEGYRMGHEEEVVGSEKISQDTAGSPEPADSERKQDSMDQMREKMRDQMNDQEEGARKTGSSKGKSGAIFEKVGTIHEETEGKDEEIEKDKEEEEQKATFATREETEEEERAGETGDEETEKEWKKTASTCGETGTEEKRVEETGDKKTEKDWKKTASEETEMSEVVLQGSNRERREGEGREGVRRKECKNSIQVRKNRQTLEVSEV